MSGGIWLRKNLPFQHLRERTEKAGAKDIISGARGERFKGGNWKSTQAGQI